MRDQMTCRAHSRLLWIVAVALLTTTFGPAAAQQEPAVRETLRLSMSGAFQPFSTTDSAGRLVGFDADIASELARRMGYQPKLVQTDWAGIQAGLQAGKYELICGSMAITPERLQSMHFSLPYYVSGAQIFVLQGIKDLAGARIGVTEDSTYAGYITDHPEEFRDCRIIRYGSEAEIVAAMGADKIDAFVSDLIVGGFYIQKGGASNIAPWGDLLYQEACGIAARQDDAALVHALNQALFSIVQDGTYTRIYEKWVGGPPDLEVLLASWSEFAPAIPPLDTTPVAADTRPEFAERVVSMLPLLAKGAWVTIFLSVITALLALLSGSLLGVAAALPSGLARWFANGYIWVVRGTPLLVQLFISYYAFATLVNRLVGFELIGALGAALIALVVNTTAYNAETLRGGINAVDKGQWDASASLGMTRSLIMRRVLLPQAFHNSLPSLGNNLVVLIKDTSLVGAITLLELTYSARNIVFQSGQAFLPFVLAAGFYLAIISLVTVGVRLWERHFQRSRQAVGRML